MAPRENNAYAKFWGNKQRLVCYVSGVVTCILAYDLIECRFFFFFTRQCFLEAERARTAFESGTIGGNTLSIK